MLAGRVALLLLLLQRAAAPLVMDKAAAVANPED
jgi:hypothetical protein